MLTSNDLVKKSCTNEFNDFYTIIKGGQESRKDTVSVSLLFVSKVENQHYSYWEYVQLLQHPADRQGRFQISLYFNSTNCANTELTLDIFLNPQVVCTAFQCNKFLIFNNKLYVTKLLLCLQNLIKKKISIFSHSGAYKLKTPESYKRQFLNILMSKVVLFIHIINKSLVKLASLSMPT